VGNTAFALRFGRAVHHAFRIVNDGDFITGLFKFKYVLTKAWEQHVVQGHFTLMPTSDP
jgi:hypothetical protein